MNGANPGWHFSKYHGLGNDFIIADLREREPSPSPQDPRLVQALCDRRFGVGADGVLAVLPPTRPGADARMRTLNADGSEAEMCGNGIRCVAKYLYDRFPALHKNDLAIETAAGILICSVTPGQDTQAESITVDMGPPRPGQDRWVDQPLTVDGRTFRLTNLSMGNPHAVIFVDETGPALRALAEKYGPLIEAHPMFPKKTNVEFVRRTRPGELETVVWERGCGITLACGTGACAVTKAAVMLGHVVPDTEITVKLLGGHLGITVPEGELGVLMRGPATWVYDAEIDLGALSRTLT